jgi:HK97 family phage prohead protease
MKITYAAPIVTADASRRTITGIVAPFGEVGNTSAGPVVFEAGAFGDVQAEDIKFLLEHDLTRPIGRATTLMSNGDGIVGTFRIAATTAGSDALIEAAEGLRDGISVGAVLEEWETRDGAIHVTKASLVEVSLVHRPAFETARVLDVAASDASPETPDTPQEQEPMSETTPEVVDAPVVVDASHVPAVASAPQPVAYTRPRIEPMTAGSYLRHSVLAMAGRSDSRDLLAAVGTTDVPGLLPTEQSKEIIGVIDQSRRFINSIERRPLPTAGMRFQVPVRLTKVGDMTIIAEGDPVDEGDTTIDWIDVDVEVFKRRTTLSVEAIERTDPAILQDLLVQYAESYAQATNKYAIEKALENASYTEEPAGSDLAGWVTAGIADSAAVMRFAPDRLLLDLTAWSDFKNERDGNERPLFPHLTPQNAPGQLAGTALAGDVEGLGAFVDFDAPAATQVVYPSAAVRFYEGAGQPAQVRAVQVSSMEYEIGVYGFVAFLPKYPTAVRILGTEPDEE